MDKMTVLKMSLTNAKNVLKMRKKCPYEMRKISVCLRDGGGQHSRKERKQKENK